MSEKDVVTADRGKAVLITAAAGDRAAADRLFRLFGDQVLGFVSRRLGDRPQDAEEIVVDTFMSALKMAKGYDGKSSVLTWLCGIARVRIIDYYRRAGVRQANSLQVPLTEEISTLIAGEGLEGVLDRLDGQRVLDALFSTLNDDERDALIMRYADQMSVREIAQVLGRTEKAAEGLLTRAKNKPRAVVKQWFAGDAI